MRNGGEVTQGRLGLQRQIVRHIGAVLIEVPFKLQWSKRETFQLNKQISSASINIGDIRVLVEASNNYNDTLADAFISKAKQTFGVYLEVLEKNQDSRQRYVQLSSPSAGLEQELNKLKKCIEEAKCTVNSSQQFLGYLTRRKRDIFDFLDEKMITRSFKQVMTFQSSKEQDNNHQTVISSESEYLQLYELNVQYLMTLLNTIEKTGEERQKDVKAIGRSLLADNMLSRLEADIGQMIRFVLKLGTGYTERVNKQLGMIREMREQLIDSTLRCYYLCFMCNNDLESVAAKITKRDSSYHLDQFQKRIKVIKKYITETAQRIYKQLYNSLFVKRIVKIQSIQQTLKKLKEQGTNGKAIIMNREARNKEQIKNEITTRVNNIREMFNVKRPLNQSNFTLLFSQIQTTMLSISECLVSDQQTLIRMLSQLEREIIADYCLDSEGKRKDIKSMHESRSVRSSQKKTIHQNVFQQQFDEIMTQLSKQNIPRRDRTKLSTEIRAYIDSVRQSFGYELNDSMNFNIRQLASLLQISASVSKTEEGLLEEIRKLKQLSGLLLPEINSLKLSELVYPAINCDQFAIFYKLITGNFQKLTKRQLQNVTNQKQNNISAFLTARTEFLKTILEQANLDKILLIMQTIIGLRCYKKSHDAASMATYDIVLKLLLADKEVSAYELGLKSQIGIGKHLKKVADIVCTHIYEKLIATLREIFISPQMSPKRTLSDLLEGINMCIDFVQQCDHYFEELIRKVSAEKIKQALHELYNNAVLKLSSLERKGRDLFERISIFERISCSTVQRHVVRLQELIEICKKQGQAQDIVDQQANKFYKLVLSKQ